MATYTDSLGFNKGSAALRADGLTKVTRMEVVLDFAKIAAARSAAGAAALASGDVLEVIPVPAKTLVMRVGYDVTTAEGATATFDLGDGSDADGYLNDVDLNSVGSGVMSLALTEGTPNTIAGYSNGKYYSAADTIDMTLNNNAINAAVVRVWALVADASAS
jgi:hypothetical protein